MDQKDYTKWHKVKSDIHNKKKRPYFHEREIWFCSLGSNVGFEQDGRGDLYLRPVVVIRKFNNEVCLVVPMTKNVKKSIHYFNFSYEDGVTSTAILSQVKLIDTKRLVYKSGNISKKDFSTLKKKLRQLIA
ncbi:MAG: type II toxin-antitoxin system PemK/MazF family toxin [bacterium]|nr:type II toxin-antitoxin system PemK/MazF family toxin [bacterium]MDZ4231522.1 type II toxin-antitoxin system PemK/MazF family toxin [Patescibacteria group bacterium]